MRLGAGRRSAGCSPATGAPSCRVPPQPARSRPPGRAVRPTTCCRFAVAPSQQLLAVAAAEIQDREQFVLSPSSAWRTRSCCTRSSARVARDTKRVVIVNGGPGCGKSVIALSLLGELARQRRSVLHATGSRSFTQTLRQVAGRRAPPGSSRLFKYFNQFMEAERNGLDVMICDEAHRIRETSVDRYTKSYAAHRPSAGRRADRRRARPGVPARRAPGGAAGGARLGRVRSPGTPEVSGLEVQHIGLDEQFRCGGSEAYVLWVQRLLGLDRGRPVRWDGDPAFEVRVVDSPEELAAALEAKRDMGYGARMTAGYCWPWSDPREDGSLVDDVVIDGWSRPWNLKSDRAVGGAPPAPLWASDPAGFGQVGCVYTAQGFEYDWNGVIIGPDLVWRTDRWVTAPVREPRPGLPQHQAGPRRGVRRARAQRLQGAAHPRHDRHAHPLRGSRDSTFSPNAR